MSKLIVAEPSNETFESAMQKYEAQEKAILAPTETPEQKSARETAEANETPEQKAARVAATPLTETPEQKTAREAAEALATQANETPEQKTAREAAEAEKAKTDVSAGSEYVMPEAFKTVFPEAQKPEDIISVYNTQKAELQDVIQANDDMVAVLNKDKELIQVTKAVAEGKSLIEAIRLLPDIETRIAPPDFEDREAYDKYMREKIEAETQAKELDKQRAEQRRISDEATTHAKGLLEGFVKAKNLSQEQRTNFVAFMRELTYGDPKTGKLPDNALDQFYRLYTMRDTMKAQADEADKLRIAAELKARNEGIEAAAKAREKKGDGIPGLTGGGPTQPASEVEKMIESFKPKSRLIVRNVA